ncbi:MAG TPA: adenylate/guanylate cyclase domain-containing protein [Acetobacteraceae bacterium]|nr:adenylate/guanylate cyclase domain-containing protein [Acetobacteraceae bacterium]
MSVAMASEQTRRKLIAVLYADMVGYSRLIGLDDAGTLERLRALRGALIDPAIDEHGGRIAQTGGDSLLVVFDSIDGAVRCAVKVQQQIPIHDAGQSPDRSIRFRIGINIGDAIADGTDLHGDAVNVAARLQAECPPGAICVTRAVRDHVHGRLDLVFAGLGTLNLKNISHPVEAYVLQLDGGATIPGSAERSRAHGTSDILPARDKPSIAVLPFDNLSGDPDQQYFADGLTEDILTALARFTQLIVIARNSTFVYKGRSVSIADVGRDLNVRYVLEGSVRRSGDRVRVAAQLIEAATSAHLWAERYDRAMTDIFALQDEITERIVTTLVSNIERSIIEQTRRKPPGSLGAYELFLHGREQRNASRYEGMLAAEALFEQAVALDPGFALAHAELAYIQYVYVTWRVAPEQRDAQLSKGFASARRALALEASLPLANRVLGILHLRAREHADAVAWSRRAVALNPGEAESYAWLANVLSYVGRSAEALEQLEHARRLDPLHPPLWDFYIGRALVHLGRYEEALPWLEACARRALTFGHWRRYLAAALAQLGRLDEARTALPDATATQAYVSIGEIRGSDSYLEGTEFDRLIDGLRKAGLPE